jgi:hypothetical protein
MLTKIFRTTITLLASSFLCLAQTQNQPPIKEWSGQLFKVAADNAMGNNGSHYVQTLVYVYYDYITHKKFYVILAYGVYSFQTPTVTIHTMEIK